MEIQTVPSVLKNMPVFIREACPQKMGHVTDFHIHDEVELLRVTKGSLLFKTSEKSYILNPGDIVFVQSRTPHYNKKLEDNTDNQLIMFPYEVFSKELIPDTCQYLSRFFNLEKALSTVFLAGTPEAEEMYSYFDFLIKEMEDKKPAYELYIESGIHSIIAFLARHSVMPTPSSLLDEYSVQKILPVLEYIDIYYNNRITLKEVSAVLNLNVSYFCRLFKQATGASFIEYLNFVRICKTENFLASSQKSITEIALDVGFSSPAYFNTIFKRYKGCTPTEYRRSRYLQPKHS